ncbi:MAG: hypothetical protein BWY56_02613 [Acidobacteria bacterium ADurb.Bin340]|nr:MAG: hypothetical protein BWY56_02613 [Acidobacteria bacterium ADurb.Bin340]
MFGRQEAVGGAQIRDEAHLPEAAHELEEELQIDGPVEGGLEAFPQHQAAARRQVGPQVRQGCGEILGHVQHVDAHDAFETHACEALVLQRAVHVQSAEAEGKPGRDLRQGALGPAEEGRGHIRETVVRQVVGPLGGHHLGEGTRATPQLQDPRTRLKHGAKGRKGQEIVGAVQHVLVAEVLEP